MKKPSLKNFKENLKSCVTKKNAKRLGLSLLAAAVLVPGGILYNYADSNEFTLRKTLGKVDDKTGGPGFHFNIPLIQYTHNYDKRVQSIDYNVGGTRFFPWGESTVDKNHLSASMKLNYRVTEDTKKLGYHAWAMDGIVMQDGYWLLTKMMNKSGNAVMGSRTLAESVADPKKFTEEFYEDLDFRLEENNVPVEIESIEFKKFNTFFPTHSVSYQKFVNPKLPKPPVLKP